MSRVARCTVLPEPQLCGDGRDGLWCMYCTLAAIVGHSLPDPGTALPAAVGGCLLSLGQTHKAPLNHRGAKGAGRGTVLVQISDFSLVIVLKPCWLCTHQASHHGCTQEGIWVHIHRHSGFNRQAVPPRQTRQLVKYSYGCLQCLAYVDDIKRSRFQRHRALLWRYLFVSCFLRQGFSR